MNFTVPNLLSVLRMALIPLFIIAILDGRPERALLLFAAAGVTDAMDGAIARIFHQQSVLGAYLDPMADKLLLTSAYVVLAIPGLLGGAAIPVWVTALVIARDVIIVVLAVVLYLALGVTRFPPSPLSKVNTAVQLAAVILVLLSAIVPGVEVSATIAVYLVAIFTIASGLDYIRRANRMAAKT